MGRHKRKHNHAFRDEACKLVREQGYSAREAARQLGLPHNTFVELADGARTADVVSQEQEKELGDDPKVLRIRIKELEKRVQQLEMEKQILKKATAFFAQEQQT